MNEPLAHVYVSPKPQRAAELFALVADAIQFLGRTAWPVVDQEIGNFLLCSVDRLRTAKDKL